MKDIKQIHMNKPIVILACLLPFSAFSQKAFKITGKMGIQNNPETVYFDRSLPGGPKMVDSAKVVNGTFSFTGTVAEPQAAIIAVRYQQDQKGKIKDYLPVYLENSNLNVSSPDSIRNARVSGSKINDENQLLKGQLKVLISQSMKLNREMMIAERENPDVKNEAWYKAKADTLNKLKLVLKEVRINYVKTHPDNYYSLFVLDTYVTSMGEFVNADAQQIFNGLSPALKMTSLGKEIAQNIRRINARQIGSTVADFKQTDIQGKLFALSSLRGKYVLLDFWASWCGPCRQENPNVKKAYSKLKDKGFEVVGVSLDSQKGAWEKAVQTDGLPWIQISDLKGWMNDVALQFAISSVPQNFLIDPNGVIIATNLRGEDLDEQLAAFIK